MSDGYVLTDEDAPMWDSGLGEMPWDLMAEQAALGGMLTDRRVIDDVLAAVRGDQFYEPKHEVIYDTIAAVHHRGDPVDVVSIGAELGKVGKLRNAGDLDYLWTLTSNLVTSANAEYHAARVQTLWQRRLLIETGIRTVQRGRASEGDISELIDDARRDLESVDVGSRGPLHSIGDGLLDLAEALDEKPNYIPTPWSALDRLIGGFAPGRLYYVGARPNEGKSVALLNAATSIARHGTVAFSSLEMSEQELQMRLVAAYGQLSLTRLERHTLTRDDWDRFRTARTAILGAPIFVDRGGDSGKQTMTDIRAHVRRVARMGNMRGVFIDYLQLIQATGPDRRVAIDDVSRQAKQLAKEFRVPVVAAAQLRRAGTRKGLPTMDDFREAGGLEQDADVVILLHREPKRPHERVVIVAKNRHGDIGKFRLRFTGEHARLEDYHGPQIFDEEDVA